ncbi:hypothetical protein GO003_019815 [Methylicorpusculum oleiharenae]|uniref:hypothetical protein n=1 Tax=Methylicorpusculum oleiharenae TaxID=1338687 RepID=UPI001357EF2F|nr:hypothetical protein [Methylicorpusculum oleiharenae]MBS3954118.1 hypothetical protein [Methylomicrobium sp.]MCD2452634.1 hypothetical protein [Methylicorpusculum oleiharenae]
MIQEEPKKDRFWLYVGLFTFSLVAVLLMVKMNENEKFEPIKQQLIEEEKQMNIRVIGNR